MVLKTEKLSPQNKELAKPDSSIDTVKMQLHCCFLGCNTLSHKSPPFYFLHFLNYPPVLMPCMVNVFQVNLTTWNLMTEDLIKFVSVRLSGKCFSIQLYLGDMFNSSIRADLDKYKLVF